MNNKESEDRLSFQNIKTEFERIKSMGFIKSNRSNSTGIGKTFEDYLGVKENNIKDPDFEIFEIKSQRELSNSYVTLTTKEPTQCNYSINDLRLEYGTPDLKYPSLQVLHTSFFANKSNKFNNKFSFQLENDLKNNRVYIIVKDIDTQNIINKNVFYTYDEIEGSLKKLTNLFFVNADKKKIKNNEYFHFTKAFVFLNLNIKSFYELLNNGKIMFDIRYGAYKSGKLAGKLHNHGCGFRVKKENLINLYDRGYPLS